MLQRTSAAPDREADDRPATHRRRRTYGAVIALAALLVLLLVGGAVLAWQWRPDAVLKGPKRTTGPASATPGPKSAAGQGRAPTFSKAPIPDPAKLAAALRGPLADDGFSGSPQLEVMDLLSGRLLFGRNQQVPQTPASTLKLVTATVVLTEFGPQTRFETRAFSAGNTIYLVGGGDPTLAPGNERSVQLTHGRLNGPGRMADLAHQIRAAGVTRADRVVGDAGLFTGPPLAAGWRPDYLQAQVAPVSALTVQERRTATPSLTAAGALRDALTAAGVPTNSFALGHVPPRARLVGHVSSPPLSALVGHMLAESDNDLAEALGRLLAIRTGHPADFAGAAAALHDGLERLGLPTDAVRLNDASGLSLDDRIPPALLVEILRRASDPAHPELKPLVDGLPVAGRTGTLALRYQTPATKGGAGVVRAKSGRVLGMNALAGFVTTKNGRVLVFALRAPTANLTSGEQAVDRVAATLAGCGCR